MSTIREGERRRGINGGDLSLVESLGRKNFKKGLVDCAKCCTEVVAEGKAEAPLVTFQRAASELEHFKGQFSKGRVGSR